MEWPPELLRVVPFLEDSVHLLAYPFQRTLQTFAVGPGASVTEGGERRDLFPEIEPFETGFLPVGDGAHELYYEVCGASETLCLASWNYFGDFPMWRMPPKVR